jgi:hypothetical protein
VFDEEVLLRLDLTTNRNAAGVTSAPWALRTSLEEAAFGTPEDKMRDLEEHHEEAVRGDRGDRVAKQAHANGTPRPPWYKRLFRRS